MSPLNTEDNGVSIDKKKLNILQPMRNSLNLRRPSQTQHGKFLPNVNGNAAQNSTIRTTGQ